MDLIVTSGGLGPTADDLTAEVVADFAGREMALDAELEEPHPRDPRAAAGAGGATSTRRPSARATASRRWCRAGPRCSSRWARRPGSSCRLGRRRTDRARAAGPAGRAAADVGDRPRDRAAARRAGRRWHATSSGSCGCSGRRSPRSRRRCARRRRPACRCRAWRSPPACGAGRSRSRRCSRPTPRRTTGRSRRRCVERHGAQVFARDGETIDELVAAALLGPPVRTVATAESCTGGLMAARLTDRAGSSAYALGGVTAYSNEAKVDAGGRAGRADLAHGAVSPEVAVGAGRRRAGALRGRRRHRHHRDRRAGRRDAGEAGRDGVPVPGRARTASGSSGRSSCPAGARWCASGRPPS